MLYDNVGEVRNADAAMRWSVAQVFLIIHSGLFTVFMTRLAEEIIAQIAISFMGGLLGLLWLLITNRTQELLMYWNDRLRVFEQAGRQAIYVFGGQEFRELQEKRFTTYGILVVLIFLITGIWSFLFVVLVALLKKPYF